MLAVFEVDVETRWGDTVAVVGAPKELGCWQPERAVPLCTSPASYPTWRGEIVIDAKGGTAVNTELKLIILRASGHTEWEPIEGNRALRVVPASSSPHIIQCRWGVHAAHPLPPAKEASDTLARPTASFPSTSTSSAQSTASKPLSPPTVIAYAPSFDASPHTSAHALLTLPSAEMQMAEPRPQSGLTQHNRSFSWSEEMPDVSPFGCALHDKAQPLWTIGSLDQSWPPSIASSPRNSMCGSMCGGSVHGGSHHGGSLHGGSGSLHGSALGLGECAA